MMLGGINSKMWHTTVTIEEVARVLNDVGDPSETWSELATGVKAIIRPAKLDKNKVLLQGAEYTFDAKGYLEVDTGYTVKNGQRLVDSQSGKTYDIIGAMYQYPANSSVASAHHIKVFLQVINDTKN